MKYNKLFLLGVVLLGLSFTAQAQSKYAVINTKYILDRIPEYKEADKKLKALGDQWQQDLDLGRPPAGRDHRPTGPHRRGALQGPEPVHHAQ